MTDSPVLPLHSLPLMAGMAVQAGMDRADALKAITLNAAEMDADLSVYDGDPLEITGSAWMVVIDGKVVFKK